MFYWDPNWNRKIDIILPYFIFLVLLSIRCYHDFYYIADARSEEFFEQLRFKKIPMITDSFLSTCLDFYNYSEKIKTLHIIAFNLESPNKGSIIFLSELRDRVYICSFLSKNSVYELHKDYNLNKLIVIFNHYLEDLEDYGKKYKEFDTWKYKNSVLIEIHEWTEKPKSIVKADFYIKCEETYNLNSSFWTNHL